jgi:type VI secretion system protein ImpA
MSAPDIEALLKPVSPESECGPNMEYEPVFFELQELARGKPEQQIGDRIKPAQEPSWPKVRDAAEALFGSTKDLRVAGVLLRALIKVDGIAGLSASLAVVEGLLSRYWDQVHPLLDAEDDNDPTFRLNALTTALAGDDAIAALRLAPLVESRQFGRLSLRNHRIATGALKVESADGQTVDVTQE